MQLDEGKILTQLKTLGTHWIPASGLHAVTSLEFDGSQAIFNPTAGLPVKVFINTKTGELKLFHAATFERKQE